MWWCFGWPYETSVAMCRLVFWGLFDRFPDLKIITHHCGDFIPYYDGRVGPGLAVLGSRTSGEALPSMKRPRSDYFKKFYGDIAMFGGTSWFGTGYDYFGAECAARDQCSVSPRSSTTRRTIACGLNCPPPDAQFTSGSELRSKIR
jgi:hypothetical protein